MRPTLKSFGLTLLLVCSTPLCLQKGYANAVPAPANSGKSTILAQATPPQDRKAEGDRLNNEGEQLRQRGQFRAALEKYQQALAIVKAIGEQEVEGVILNNIGLTYHGLEKYSEALELYQ